MAFCICFRMFPSVFFDLTASAACSCIRIHTYEWVTSYVSIRHVTQMDGSRYTYRYVDRSQKWMSPVTHMDESRSIMDTSRHTYDCLSVFFTSPPLLRVPANVYTYMNESRHTYNKSRHTNQWVTSHMWTSNITRRIFQAPSLTWPHPLRVPAYVNTYMNESRHMYE